VPAGSCTTAQETYTYNNRLQAAMIELGTTSGSPSADYRFVYNYYSDKGNPTSCAASTQGTKDNGNVMGYWYQDSVNSSFSHTATYSYDGVNRLLTAVAAPIALGTYNYNLTFSYKTPDNSTGQYGNMSCVTNAQTAGYCLNLSFNSANNQVSTSGYAYDAAGNLTKDSSNSPTHIYQWDAEGRVSAVDPGSSPTWAFTYNALGHRAQWAYGSAGAADQHLFDPEGNWLGNYGEYTLVRFGDRMLVAYESSETYFNHVNSIGSTSIFTNHAGAAAEDIVFQPWGQVGASWGTGGYGFADLPYYDTTTGTSVTLNRFYSMSPGRWQSPDPNNAGADASDPQTWNMYAYVRNNPTKLTDQGGDDYIVCTNDELGQRTCTRVTDDAGFNEALKDPGPGVIVKEGINGSGTIYTTDANTGQLNQEGTYQWVPPTAQEEATVDATNTAINIALAAIGAVRAVGSFGAGILEGFAGREAEGAAAAVEEVVQKAGSAVGGQEVTVANEGVAQQAADEFLGPGKEVIPDRTTGAFKGWKSADGTRVVIDTHQDAVGPHMNFHNLLTGGNLHVRW
jgi:RHS repeat-associated protein